MKIRVILAACIIIPGLLISCSWERECIEGDCGNGTGVCMYPEHYRYTGTFRNGMRSGKGTIEKVKNFDWFPSTQVIKYTGMWAMDKGYGTSCYFHGQIAYQGTWKDD